jgi:uncharacterized protein (TIGR03067 family)
MNTAKFLALALPLAAPQLKDRPGPDPPLGRWAADDMFIAGQSSPQWLGLEYEFAAGGRWVIYRDGRQDPGGPRSYTADSKAKPAAIDLTEGKDIYPGVYKVGPDGDTLTVSFSYAPGGARPTGIEPGGGIMTITFKRVREVTGPSGVNGCGPGQVSVISWLLRRSYPAAVTW